MCALATPWRSVRAYATGRKSRLGPALSLEHVRSLHARWVKTRHANGMRFSSFNEHGSSPFIGQSCGLHGVSRIRKPARRHASLYETSSRDTAGLRTLSVPQSYHLFVRHADSE